jgi:hypothetical protein
MIEDGGREEGTEGCTKCTKPGVAGPGQGCEQMVRAELPEPEPDLFVLAGVAAGRANPGDARALRARAELQAALAERNRVRR